MKGRVWPVLLDLEETGERVSARSMMLKDKDMFFSTIKNQVSKKIICFLTYAPTGQLVLKFILRVTSDSTSYSS